MTATNTQQLLELLMSQNYKRWPVVTINNEFIEYSKYVNYVLDQLELQLLHNKYVVITINNGSNEVVNRQTLQHDFILYANGTSIIKLEHYMPFYQSCISSGENWRYQLMTLFNATTDSDRLILWNNMFSARECQDNNNSLRIRLHINPDIIKHSRLNNVSNTYQNNITRINHKRALSHI